MGKGSRRRKGLLRLLGLSILSTILFRLSFPAPSLGFLGWAALAPLFWISAATTMPRAALCSGLSGLLVVLLSLWGFHNLTWAAYVAPALLGMIYYAAMGAAISWCCARRGLSLLLVAPPLWTSYEYIRSVVPVIKFPWLLAGHTQVGVLEIIQVVDLGGVYLLSFVVVFFNATLAQGARDWGVPARRRKVLILGLLPLGLVAACWLYGAIRIRTIQMAPGPTIALVQGNIPQEIKLRGQGQAMMTEYLLLSEQCIQEDPSLLVWPETMYPWPLADEEIREEEAPELRRFFEKERDKLVSIARRGKTRLLIGALRRTGNEMRNSAHYISWEGEVLGRYDKIDLVPLGEAIPFDRSWPALGKLIRTTFLPKGFGSLSPGDEIPIFEIDGSRFAASICYEISFAGLARQARLEGADFFVSISNDAWFKNGAELDLAKDQAIFRAVENRVGIARAANTGISSFVDPLGRSEILTREGKRKQVRGTLTREILISPNRTVYSRVGDLFAWAAILASILILLPLKRLQREARSGPRES